MIGKATQHLPLGRIVCFSYTRKNRAPHENVPEPGVVKTKRSSYKKPVYPCHPLVAIVEGCLAYFILAMVCMCI